MKSVNFNSFSGNGTRMKRIYTDFLKYEWRFLRGGVPAGRGGYIALHRFLLS